MIRKILLDTNAYLRLAEVFHPLMLSQIPGERGGELWILPELYRELKKNPRLRHSFSWAFAPEFVENRKQCRWHLAPDVRSQIESTYQFAMRYSQQIQNSASPFDIRCLAYGSVLDSPVVTDDAEMRLLAEELEISSETSIELLKVMLDAGFCSIEKVRSTVRYWITVDDLPGQYRKDYRRCFSESPPDSAY
jgi:hypothetical protein